MGEAKRRQKLDPDWGKWKIRSYEPRDLDRVLQIEEEEDKKSQSFLGEKKILETKKSAEEFLSHANSLEWVSKYEGKGLGWVLEYNGEVVGFTYIIQRSNKVKLVHLYVLGAYQRKGNGTRLMERVKSLKKYPIELAVYEKNELAFNFYVKQGFSKVDEKEEDGLHYVVMSCAGS